MTIRHSIRIFGKPSRKGFSLYLRLTLYRRQADYPLHLSVRKEDFIDNIILDQRAQRKAAEAISVIENILQHYEIIEKRTPTTGEIRDEYNKLYSGKEVKIKRSLSDYVEEFKEEEGAKRSWTPSTYQKFDAMLKNLLDYDPRCSLDRITESYLQGLVEWYVRNDYKNPTIAKKFGFIRWFLRWCENKNYYQGNAYKFSVKLKGQNFEQKTIIYLEKKELSDLENFPFKQPYLDKARDLFIFSCYTGLRYSDIARLERSQINNDKINVVTQKTNDSIVIDLNEHTKRILEKYKNYRKALPVISNQKANDYIREACRIAGIDSPVKLIYYSGKKRIEEVKEKWQCMSFHAARRTFITIALLLEIPVPVIMQWSGHHDVKMLKPYMKVVDELRKREMNKFNNI